MGDRPVDDLLVNVGRHPETRLDGDSEEKGVSRVRRMDAKTGLTKHEPRPAQTETDQSSAPIETKERAKTALTFANEFTEILCELPQLGVLRHQRWRGRVGGGGVGQLGHPPEIGQQVMQD